MSMVFLNCSKMTMKIRSLAMVVVLVLVMKVPCDGCGVGVGACKPCTQHTQTRLNVGLMFSSHHLLLVLYMFAMAGVITACCIFPIQWVKLF